MKEEKYFRFIFLISCLFLSGCFFIPCKTTLSIKNEGNEAKIILIDYNGNSFNYKIQNNTEQYFKNNIMNKILYVYISNNELEGIFELREFDHWSPLNHNIKIKIQTNNFEYNEDRKKIFFEFNDKTLIEKDGNIDFEEWKKSRYSDIYDIIKRE